MGCTCSVFRSSSSPRTPSTDGGDPTPPIVPRTPHTSELIEEAYRMKNTMHLDAFQTAMGRKHTDFSLGAMKHTEQMDYSKFAGIRRMSQAQDFAFDIHGARWTTRPSPRPPGGDSSPSSSREGFHFDCPKRFLNVGGAGCKVQTT